MTKKPIERCLHPVCSALVEDVLERGPEMAAAFVCGITQLTDTQITAVKRRRDERNRGEVRRVNSCEMSHCSVAHQYLFFPIRVYTRKISQKMPQKLLP
jgi:hypothetical protein